MTQKKVIAVDLDGTLAHYDGFKGDDHIGEPIEAMVHKVNAWHNEGHEIVIFTARLAGCDPEQSGKIHDLINEWTLEHGICASYATCIKEKRFTEFWDDRSFGIVANTGILKDHHADKRSAMNKQVGGNHYKKLAIQPAEYTQKNRMNGLESNVVKYVTRHQDKNGKVDLEKAIHCLEMIIEMEYDK